ncbi:MAG TPA: GNAT family N-acetyltransferase [Acidimicrobiales bacterium]|jgi:GNAT superfamily N-acetyltransferase|nr:GNAT family N-acetyltransferase [Acidimicrobiales bacterium]
MSPRPSGQPDVAIRPATPEDVDDLVQMIHDLAEYERSPGAVEVDRHQLHDALFAETPSVFSHVAEAGGRVVGMAIWFLTFSTWTGRSGIYLEDLYVRPDARGRGVGGALVSELAATARRCGYRRVEWAVLDWNEPALRFYRSLGAVPMTGWTSYRLSGAELSTLGAPPSSHRPAGRR